MGAYSGLRLSVLGPIVASLDEHPLPKLRTIRAQGLLIYLAVEAALGTAEHRREVLMDLFWPGVLPKSARKNLRTTLYYLRQAKDILSESLQLRHEIGDKGGMAWCLEKLAEIALIKGQKESSSGSNTAFRRAARLFGMAASLRAPGGSIKDLIDQPEYDRQLAELHTQLGEATFEAAWAEGQLMTLEQAVAYVLDEP